jgi:Icc-related predicted phosphoesterase
MKVLVFSDIHSDLGALSSLMEMETDYYVAAGDLVNFAHGLEKVGEILKPRGKRVWVLPGNHESERDIARLCADYGLNEFHGRSFELQGFHVAGLGYSNITPFRTPGEYSESELAMRLRTFERLKPLVLICHCPPRNTPLDGAIEGSHFGSDAVRDFIESQQPSFFLCGHVHESAGVSCTLGKTRAANVGKRGYLLDFDTLAP